ncbi:adhesion G-protein coupled receptor D2 isoform X2 [Dunckerocampus dactyliophorus]|uniref:adhesion G-protein coupled receptor D2 isoform X2 n=1 Tax=Dunckerocampus dactyliophorus TaxID=161453 RepID=UPI002405FA2F|nr:adhesion G-protein coupled receptor D2 isoform X2 [Dunckerocampus dactyliophorus]
MHRLMSPDLSLLVFFHCCLTAFTLETRTVAYETSYEYIADELPWDSARERCYQRSGSLASVSTPVENQEINNFLTSLNVSEAAWIGQKFTTHLQSSSETLILEFTGRSDRKNARLLLKFPSLDAVTVCAYLRFDPNCYGISTIFSYSIQSRINEFQLRANLVQGKPVQLALLVHGIHGAYQEVFNHDGSWHWTCVSWKQNGGRWTLLTDGRMVYTGDGLNSSDSIGPDGLFIIGQEQDTFGGSFKKDESFSGSVTELHIWDRVLSRSEMDTMEKECSPATSGLIFKWSGASVEVESSLTKLWGSSPCKGNISAFDHAFLDSILEGNALQTFSVTFVDSTPPGEECGVFDPATGSVSLEKCDSYRGAVCQFKKEVLDAGSFPKTAFFRILVLEHLAKPEQSTYWDSDLAFLHQLTQAALHIVETGGPNVLTSSDVHFLSQKMEMELSALASGHTDRADAAEAMVSIATDYVKMASVMLEPHVAQQWMGLTDDGISVGPFTLVNSIDNLTETLADMLFAEGRGFSLSTKNIDVFIRSHKLSQESCCQSFKPSDLGMRGNDQDELLIPDSELQRIQKLGHKDVMFIHTHYSHLNEVLSATPEPSLSEQEKVKRTVPGHLASAVISATVRDASKAQTIPVAVKYKLGLSHVMENAQRFTPVCAFWNFSLMDSHTSGWSSEGCSVIVAGSGVTSCQCNHTTNFAVLMNYFKPKWSPEEELVLTKLTFIGSGASLCALVVTLMLFTVLDIPRSDRTSIHKNLFIALICAQVILLCSGSAIHNKVACTLVAALLHLFFMAAFSWMLVEGLLLWSKVVAVNLSEERHMKYYYLIGWGLPVLIVTITLASASGKYLADGYCWLSVQNGVIWSFAGPVIFIIMVNIMVLTRVVVITISTAKRRSIMLQMGASPVEQAYEQVRAAVKAVLVLLPILGLTWLCGVLVPFSIVMAYIFILLNSLQGLFIFLIYGVYNTEVRSTVNRIKERRKALHFSNCASSRPSSSVTSSRPISFPQATTPSQEEAAAPFFPNSNTQCLQIEDDSRTSQLPIPCAPTRVDNTTSQSSTGAHLQRKAPPSSQVDASPPGCSLHVPMELEFTASCFSSSASS